MDPTPRKLQITVQALEQELATVLDLSTTSEEKRIELRERLRKLKERVVDRA
jgi:hypothetical protein